MSDEDYSKATVKFDPSSGFEFTDIDSMFRAAACYLQSGLAPGAFKTPQQLVICWAKGAELGLRPLQAIDGMTIVGQRVGLMGDLALSMVRASGLLAKYEKEWTGEGDNLTCKVTLQRKDSNEHHYTFSVAEAKLAGIYERSTTWKGYPRRMTYYRALGFGLRDEFSDVLKGLYTSEELEDLDHFENLAADKANVRYVDVDGTQEAATPTSSQTTTAPSPPLEAQLRREYAGQPAGTGGGHVATTPVHQQPKEEKLMGPSADFAETKAGTLPDDIPMDTTPLDNQAPPAEPQKPWWVDHEIKGVRSFAGRTVGSLTPTELGLIETKWVPAAHQQIAKATEEQLKDLKAFEERIAHDKTAKPW